MTQSKLKSLVGSSQVWFKFTKNVNGKNMNFRWEPLQNHRFEEFVDFKMKYYVRNELTHKIAGIYKNSRALEEYRNIVSDLYKDPIYQTSICCIDDDSSKIIGFDSIKLYKRGDIYKDFVEAETPEVQRYYDIVQKFDKLCPVSDILNRYNVDLFFDDAGMAIQPEYNGFRISFEVALLRRLVSKSNGVSLIGAWMTSPAVQQSAKKDGWKTIFKISSEQLEQILRLRLPRTQMFIYGVKNVI